MDFDAFFRSSYPRLEVGLSAATPDAAGALRHAYARAHLRWRRVGARPDPEQWVRRAAVRRLLKSGRGSSAATSASVASLDGTSDHAFLRDSVLVDAIAVLPLPHRIALALRYGEDLPVAEIAATMDTSTAEVERYLDDARRFLRSAWERDGG